MISLWIQKKKIRYNGLLLKIINKKVASIKGKINKIRLIKGDNAPFIFSLRYS